MEKMSFMEHGWEPAFTFGETWRDCVAVFMLGLKM